jgi:hypothetical protein
MSGGKEFCVSGAGEQTAVAVWVEARGNDEEVHA